MVHIAKPEKVIDFRKKRRELLKGKKHVDENEIVKGGLDFLGKGNWKWLIGIIGIFIIILLVVIFRAL